MQQIFALLSPGWRRICRSASLRISFFYACIFGLSSFLFMLYIWWGTVGLLQRQTEEAITEDFRILKQEWVTGGLYALQLAILHRMEQDASHDSLYLLAGADKKHIIGNLKHWPKRVGSMYKWYRIPYDMENSEGAAEVRAFPISREYTLLIGRNARTVQHFTSLLEGTMLGAWILILLFAFCGALVIHKIFERIVRSVSRAEAIISKGGISHRVPLNNGIDELDRMALAINKVLDRITRLMDGVKQVSNAIAHDLRTPIARARTRLEDAILHADNEETLRQAVERAISDLDNVTAVFEALLRIAEIESGAKRAAFQDFDLTPLLTSITEFYEAYAEEKELHLVLQVPASLPFFGDRSMLQQAVANLLDNAIKFSPPDGKITLYAGVDEIKSSTVISVTDEGIGMDVQDMKKATERFFRAEKARSTPGSGLGLALVQAIVQLHDGTLVLSRNSPGIKAQMTFPGPKTPKADIVQPRPHQ